MREQPGQAAARDKKSRLLVLAVRLGADTTTKLDNREKFSSRVCCCVCWWGVREERRRHLRGRRREHTARLNHCSVGLRELSLNADCCVVGECTAELLIHIFFKNPKARHKSPPRLTSHASISFFF